MTRMAHARSGDPAIRAGYLGSSEAFGDAVLKFATDYAGQTEDDHDALVKAVIADQIETKVE